MQTTKRTDIRKLLDRELKRTVKSIVERNTGERALLLARMLAEDEGAE